MLVDPPLTKDELLGLMGNCIIALALSDDEEILVMARVACDCHLKELDERFPEWRQEAKDAATREEAERNLKEIFGERYESRLASGK